MKMCARFFILSSGLLLAMTALALPGDRQLPVNIEADRNRGSLGANEIIYLGNVRITQGTLTIEGDEVTVYRSDENEIRRMVAIGNSEPAWISDQLEEDQPYTHLDGEVVIYDAEEGMISAQGNARLQQGRNLVTAHFIRFYVDDEEFESDQTAPDGTTGDRVRMCLIRDDATATETEEPHGQRIERPASCEAIR